MALQRHLLSILQNSWKVNDGGEVRYRINSGAVLWVTMYDPIAYFKRFTINISFSFGSHDMVGVKFFLHLYLSHYSNCMYNVHVPELSTLCIYIYKYIGLDLPQYCFMKYHSNITGFFYIICYMIALILLFHQNKILLVGFVGWWNKQIIILSFFQKKSLIFIRKVITDQRKIKLFFFF